MTLAWAVVGLCSEFTRVEEAVESRAKQAASRSRRFERWMDNGKVQVEGLYGPMLQAALAHWEMVGRVYVALDVSVLKGSLFVLIRVSLIYTAVG